MDSHHVFEKTISNYYEDFKSWVNVLPLIAKTLFKHHEVIEITCNC